jgi:hypothetical protein
VTCCNSAIPILGQLLCNVLAIGNTCNSGQSVYCCKTDATVSRKLQPILPVKY